MIKTETYFSNLDTIWDYIIEIIQDEYDWNCAEISTLMDDTVTTNK